MKNYPRTITKKVLIKKNPLITELFEKYRSFKLRKIISEDLAVNGNGIVDLVKLDLIRKTNISFLAKWRSKRL